MTTPLPHVSALPTSAPPPPHGSGEVVEGENARGLLRAFKGPGLFITATGTGVGKTTITAALAAALHRLHIRVGICKAIASGCPKHPGRGNDARQALTDDDFLAPDAVIAARAAGLDLGDESLLPYIAPLRYAAPVSPHLAAAIEGRPPRWSRVAAALDFWQENCDALLVEGAGGWYVPLDGHDFMVADLAAAVHLPVLVVTLATLGTLNQTLLTTHAIRQRNLSLVGMVINQVPTPAAGVARDIAIDSNLKELPRLTGVPARAVLPHMEGFAIASGNAAWTVGDAVPPPPEAFIEALTPFAKEWWEHAHAAG